MYIFHLFHSNFNFLVKNSGIPNNYFFNLFFSRDYIVSGSQDGILAIWSISDDSGECIVQKQLFGRIEVAQVKYELLVTAHFGIAYDVGCITVRQIVSPVELPVIYSVYQVIFYDFF